MKLPFAKTLDYKRDVMIREHLCGRGIRDRAVIEAMREVPREEFIDADLAEQAYEDHPLAIAGGQTISQPYIVAYMTEALELSGCAGPANATTAPKSSAASALFP